MSRYIENILEPHRLFLCWQPQSGGSWFTVGEIIRSGDNADFRYLQGTDDFKNAQTKGFNGYPAFEIGSEIHHNILDVFLKRLPPKSRSDFDRYLDSFRIPPAKKDIISPFALLGYSGAKVAGDSFLIAHPYEDDGTKSFEVLTAVAGFKCYDGYPLYQDKKLAENSPVTFEKEPDNSTDPNAIKIISQKVLLGHVHKTLLNSMHHWLEQNRIEFASVERINGTDDRPLVFIFIKVRAR
jgi:hypothetical protein